MATKNIVPRATGEGSLGTADKKWAGVYANEVTVNGTVLTSKLASVDSSISTIQSSVGGKVDTSTYNTKMTSLDSSISELSSGKVSVDTYNSGMAGKVDKGDNAITTDMFRIIVGGDNSTQNSTFSLMGKNSEINAGEFYLASCGSDGTKHYLNGKPNGELFWEGKTIERVNSHSSNYIRFESGTQICWGWDFNRNNGAYENYIDYPVAFSSIPAITIQLYTAGASTWNYKLQVFAENKTNCTVIVKDANNSLTADRPGCRWIAVGRWK